MSGPRPPRLCSWLLERLASPAAEAASLRDESLDLFRKIVNRNRYVFDIGGFQFTQHMFKDRLAADRQQGFGCCFGALSKPCSRSSCHDQGVPDHA